MFASYNGNQFRYVIVGDKHYIITIYPEKADDTFTKHGSHYIKEIKQKDASNIIESHFWVKYADDIEPETEWNVDESRFLCCKHDIYKGEIVLITNHDNHGKGWERINDHISSKIIHLDDCKCFIVETVFNPENHAEGPISIKQEVFKEIFQRMMITEHEILLDFACK